MKSGLTEIDVTLEGISSILFDRFIDYTDRPAEQKLYIIDDNHVVLPAENILSGFLLSQDPKGCALAFEKTKGKDYARMGMAHIVISPDYIPFLDDKGKPIVFEGFEPGGPFQIVTASARSKSGSKSIKQEAKDRPLLRLPWQLSFNVKLFNNPLIDETKLFNWFEAGGLTIALGTWRPRYGRFSVKKWEVK